MMTISPTALGGTIAPAAVSTPAVPNAPQDRSVGAVTFYDSKKGYGFIQADAGPKLFFSSSWQQDPTQDFRPGQMASFVVKAGPWGTSWEAHDVAFVTTAADQAVSAASALAR